MTVMNVSALEFIDSDLIDLPIRITVGKQPTGLAESSQGDPGDTIEVHADSLANS